MLLLNVTALEKLSFKKKPAKVKKEKKSVFQRDSFYQELEISMREELHRKISIEMIEAEHGTLKIDFYNKEELIDIAYRLAGLRK